jgi:CheY-like chemotaxis protein
LSWSPNVEQRSLFAEILGEVARGFEEPGRPRGPGLLRLAAADAALLGYGNLSSSLKTLSGRLEVPGRPAPSASALARGLANLARELERDGELDQELESLNGIPTEPADPPPPRIYLESSPPPLPVFAAPGPAAIASPAPAMASGRALLLDPAPVHRAALARLLRRMRWDVRELDAAQPALEAVTRGEVDVLIVDARRMRLEPSALVAEVGRRAAGRPLPVVFLVEETRASEEQSLLRAGASALLRRPTDETALRRTLDALRPPGGTA